jgi:hypothetical protein
MEAELTQVVTKSKTTWKPKRIFDLTTNIVAWTTIIADIVMAGFLAGLLGVFLFVFVTAVWRYSVLCEHGSPTLFDDFLQSSMISAWVVLIGIFSGSFGYCLFFYAFVLGALCLARMDESDE